jgi:hypothetical protein
MGEEIGFLVVEGLQESPIPIGVFDLETCNHIGYLGVVADVPAQTPGALQDKIVKPLGLVLFNQDYGLLKMGLDSGLGLVELHPLLVHQQDRAPARKLLCTPNHHAIERVPDNAVGVLGEEPTREFDLVAQLGAQTVLHHHSVQPLTLSVEVGLHLLAF